MSDSREFIRRLELRRGGESNGLSAVERARPAPGTRGEEPPPIHFRRDLPRGRGGDAPPPLPAGEPVALEQAVAGEEVILPGRGAAYAIETRLSSFGRHRAELGETFARALQVADSPLPCRLERCCPLPVHPEEMLFFDIETTGLANAPLFLIGTLCWEEGDFIIRQYLARHYGEEAAVTELFLNALSARRLLVSFNGKSFDLPTVRLRATVNGIGWLPSEPAHFDLLHESRRLWRGVLPNCKLQTLEQHVCGRPPRYGDIPGSEIPAAYHAFVHTADAAQLVQIIRHNLLDLVTLAELMVAMGSRAK